MRKHHLMLALPIVVLAGLAYYASFGKGREDVNPLPVKAESAALQAEMTKNAPMMAIPAAPASQGANAEGFYDYGLDPCKADNQDDNTREFCAVRVYGESLRQQSTTELLSLWQGMVTNADSKSNAVSAVLVGKFQQLPDGDPAYELLRNLALTASDSLTLSSVAILLGEIGTASVVGIAQEMIAQGKREEGLNVLDGMASTRSIAKWDAGRNQPLPPLGDTLQTAWNNVQGDSQESYWQRVRLANIMAMEGNQNDADFLLHAVQNPAVDTETRAMLQNAVGKLNDPKLVNYLSQQLEGNQPDESAFQGSAAALVGMATPDGAKALLKWAKTHAGDTDADRVKAWFSQSAGVEQYDTQGQRYNVIKPLAESGSFQSEAVKTAVLEGIAEQERQLSPQLSQAQ